MAGTPDLTVGEAAGTPDASVGDEDIVTRAEANALYAPKTHAGQHTRPGADSLGAEFAPAASKATYSQRKTRTAGTVTMNSTTWADFENTLDLTVSARAGDVLLVTLNGRMASEATIGALDGATIVSGSPVNYVSGGNSTTSFGLMGWCGASGVNASIGGSAIYVVQAGDVVGGQVTLRLRYRTSTAANKTVLATADTPFTWAVVNLG